MRGAAAVALLGLALALPAGCTRTPTPGHDVAITVVPDGALAREVVASMRSLEVRVSGAQTVSASRALSATPFALGEERVVFRPEVGDGALLLAVIARDAAGVAVAHGDSAPVLLSPGATARARVVLRPTIDLRGGLVWSVKSVDMRR